MNGGHGRPHRGPAIVLPKQDLTSSGLVANDTDIATAKRTVLCQKYLTVLGHWRSKSLPVQPVTAHMLKQSLSNQSVASSERRLKLSCAASLGCRRVCAAGPKSWRSAKQRSKGHRRNSKQRCSPHLRYWPLTYCRLRRKEVVVCACHSVVTAEGAVRPVVLTAKAPPAFFWPGLGDAALPGLCQMLEENGEMSFLRCPSLVLQQISSGGYESVSLPGPDSLQLPIQLSLSDTDAPAAAVSQSEAERHAYQQQQQPPPKMTPCCSKQQPQAVLEAVAPTMVSAFRQQHAEAVSRQASASLNVLKQHDSTELEPEPSGSGIGSDGCGENGGEGGGADWSFGGAAGHGDDAETDAESEEESEEDLSSTDSSSSAYSSDLDERLLAFETQSVASTSESMASEPALLHASSSRELHGQLLHGLPCGLRRTRSLSVLQGESVHLSEQWQHPDSWATYPLLTENLQRHNLQQADLLSQAGLCELNAAVLSKYTAGDILSRC